MGFSTGSVAGAVGAVLVAAGIAVGGIARAAGERSLIGPSLGAAPLGAMFLGAVLVVDAAVARGIVDRGSLATGVAAAAALVWLGVAAGAGFDVGSARGVGIIPAGLALGIVVAMMVRAGAVVDEVSDIAARSLGATALTPIDAPIADRVGLLMVVAGLVAVLASRVDERAAAPEPSADGVEHATNRPALVTAAVAVALAGVGLIPIALAGIDRGFL